VQLKPLEASPHRVGKSNSLRELGGGASVPPPFIMEKCGWGTCSNLTEQRVYVPIANDESDIDRLMITTPMCDQCQKYYTQNGKHFKIRSKDDIYGVIDGPVWLVNDWCE
jgi:hypothetical protein